MTDKPMVALVDDDDAVLDSLQIYLRRRGFATICFQSAQPFLDALAKDTQFDCIVSDVRMPGLDGIALQRSLSQSDPGLPVIVITGHGDVDMAVSAVKAGAFDFLEKPIDDRRLATRIGEAVRVRRERLDSERERAELNKRYRELSNRQKQVMDLAIDGLSNKEIAAMLEISPRTVEHYRESAMERMQASNFAHLIRMALSLKLKRS